MWHVGGVISFVTLLERLDCDCSTGGLIKNSESEFLVRGVHLSNNHTQIFSKGCSILEIVAIGQDM